MAVQVGCGHVDLPGQCLDTQRRPKIVPNPVNGPGDLAVLCARGIELAQQRPVGTEQQKIVQLPQHHGRAHADLSRLIQQAQQTVEHLQDVRIGASHGYGIGPLRHGGQIRPHLRHQRCYHGLVQIEVDKQERSVRREVRHIGDDGHIHGDHDTLTIAIGVITPSHERMFCALDHQAHQRTLKAFLRFAALLPQDEIETFDGRRMDPGPRQMAPQSLPELLAQPDHADGVCHGDNLRWGMGDQGERYPAACPQDSRHPWCPPYERHLQ